MLHKWSVVLIFPFIISFFLNSNVQASSQLDDLQNDNIQVLLIFSNNSNKITPNIRRLDLVLHHFTKNVEIISEEEATLKDFKTDTHVTSYGAEGKAIDNGIVTF